MKLSNRGAGVLALAATLAVAGCASSLKQARQADEMRDYDVAVAQYTTQLRKHPSDREAQLGLERAKLRASDAHLGRGRRLFSLGKYDDAVLELQIASDLNPTNGDADRDLRAARAAPAPVAPSRAVGVPQLLVLAAGQTGYQVGQQFNLRNPTLLGRDPGSDIPVEDDFVSAQHLRLLAGGSGWLAHDLNSTNGTRINGIRLVGTSPLKPGDILDVGRLRLRFMLDR